MVGSLIVFRILRSVGILKILTTILVVLGLMVILLTRLIIGKIFDMKLWHPMAILLSLRQMDGVGAKRLLIRK